MKAFKMNGEPKLEKPYCNTCDDGGLWESKKRGELRGPYSPIYDEFICGVCITKYIFARE